jgi:hypothetical protein
MPKKGTTKHHKPAQQNKGTHHIPVRSLVRFSGLIKIGRFILRETSVTQYFRYLFSIVKIEFLGYGSIEVL